MRDMHIHVKVLGLLYIALASLGVLSAIVVFISLGSAAGIVGAAAEPQDAAVAVPIIGLVGTALIAFLLVMSLPALTVGVGLLYLTPWSRVLGIVLGALGLIFFPWGTALGIYALWVLLSKDTERLFDSATLTPPAARST